MKALTYQIRPAGWALCYGLKRFWRGCLTTRLAGLALREVDPPALPTGQWVRVRTLLGGICGTDTAILAQKQPKDSILQAFSTQPLHLGHENVGVVDEIGDEVDASWLGRRVCVDPTLMCAARQIDPACDRCRAGEFGVCQRFGVDGDGAAGLPPATAIGYNPVTGGSFSESFVAHVSQLTAVPDEMSDEDAILTDPLACGVHAALRADLMDVRNVLVYGAGVIGLSVIAGLRARGYTGRIDALDRCDYLADLAVAMGADEYVQLPRDVRKRFAAIAERTGGTVHRARFNNHMLAGGYDLVFECAGASQSVTEALKWTRAKGQVMLVGTGDGRGTDLTPVWFRELRVAGAYGRQIEHADGRQISTYQLTHELMTAGTIKTDSLLTHTFALGDYREALGVTMNKAAHRAVKVAFDFR